ncbi:MAG: hypothetical protein M0Z65_03565 [Firmicutes bacterium]|nr:hypothetical protein [Bacillota bacterium]
MGHLLYLLELLGGLLFPETEVGVSLSLLELPGVLQFLLLQLLADLANLLQRVLGLLKC